MSKGDDKMTYRELREIIDKNNDDMNKKLDHLISKTNQIHIQATKTNGRVNQLENSEKTLHDKIKELEESDASQEAWINKMKGQMIAIGTIFSVIIVIIELIFRFLI